MHYYDEIDRCAHLMNAEGITFDRGLSEDEVLRLEHSFKFTFPPDLLHLLKNQIPISRKFPNWRSIANGKDTYNTNICYDNLAQSIILGSQHPLSWGPIDLTKNIKLQLGEKFGPLPNMIQVYGHRFIPDYPSADKNPIFSSLGIDTILYGCDLVDFLVSQFNLEFQRGQKHANLTNQSFARIAVWSDVAEFKGSPRN